MKALTILLFFGLTTVSISNGLKCPMISTQTSVRNFERKCWDGSGYVGGCCAEGTCLKSLLGFSCDCEGRCKGWSADLANEANHEFSFDVGDDISYQEQNKVYSTHGRDDECKRQKETVASLSVRVNLDSCVKLWEGSGCTGSHYQSNGESIADIRTKGMSGIYSVSGCGYTAPKSVEVKLYQHSFWSLFGSDETVIINAGECKFVGEWWKDRVSMIQPKSDDCYKIWERRDCTGASYCDCGRYAFHLREVTLFGNASRAMTGDVSWNNKVSALSLCE